MEAIERLVIDKEIKKQRYEINFEKEITMKIESALKAISFDSDKNNENDFLLSKKNFDLFYKRSENDSFEIDLSNYRRCFVDNDYNIKEYVLTLLGCQQESHREIKKYNYFRFEELDRYIQRKVIHEKFGRINDFK